MESTRNYRKYIHITKNRNIFTPLYQRHRTMKPLFLMILFAISLSLNGQQHLSAYIVDKTQLTANITLQEGYTIYGLSKATGIETETLIAANPGINVKNMELKTTLSLPIAPSALHIKSSALIHPVVVMYKVQPSETLYSIAKNYAQKEVAVIMGLNKKETNTLSIGEELILGWIEWPYDKHRSPLLGNREFHIPLLPTIDTIATFISADVKIDIPTPDINNLNHTPQANTYKGIALMDKRGGGTDELVVIHKDALIDSEIQIYNPMMRRTVKAKVVAQIAKNSYPEDVSVVISPAVASALGALDRRFMVEMTYIAAQ